ncbi:MAG TPA: DUF2207 domain-containing protein [Candidatus Pseudogracilibacillus intestinigallinarum]|uniref:DUF2207 domain-containing protein n=1 Tax=Candidatus Pseudogracilibacillus intestinigallinarum TaxID=2838742 RepID=A0A9D1TK80_9BACI|nr:DUF2207 domain-containing protein [Candidatus Pseudogracilibacillus intestinigallinarum]
MRIQKFFIISVLLLLFTSIFSFEEVYASTHELEALDIHVFIEEDGSANITEKRVATLSEGTENFIVIGNLGKSTITDFSVYEDGKMYDFVEDWDVNWSKEQKTFKNGVIEEKEHYELVWGIGEYGKHEYELSYTVTDFIKQLEDSQMMFWQFVNNDTNIPPQRVTITVETDKPLTEENEKIWAFGFEGDIHFKDGKIVAKSNKPLHKNDFVTILTEFPTGNFGTNDIIDQTFEEIKEQAFEGSDYTNDKISRSPVKIILVFSFIITVLFIIAKVLNRIIDQRFLQKYKGKHVNEVPYHGDFYMAYGALILFQLSNLNQLLTAFILKWINEERIQVVYTSKKSFLRNKKIVGFQFIQNKMNDLTNSEAELFNLFLHDTQDGILRRKNFKDWSKRNKKLISKWESDLIDKSLTMYEEEGFLTREEAEAHGESYKKNHIKPKMKEFEDHVHLFKNYLGNYSSLNEPELVNVKLLDELMIWAAMLGLTKEAYKEFKALYPKYEQESVYYSYRSISVALRYANRINHAVSSRNSGAGGSASFGGGGGSFGGGSGGGTR